MAKMTKNTWLITLLVVLNLLSLGALWVSNSKDPPKEKRDHKALLDQVFKEELGLNDEQTAAFQSLTKAHFERRKENIKRMREKKRQLLEAVAVAEEDSLTIQTIVDEIIILEKTNEELFIKHFRNLKSVCTPEQQKDLARVFLKGMRPHGTSDHTKEKERE